MADKQIYPIIEVYDGGDHGYYVRADGYCEQWGRCWSKNSASWVVEYVSLFKPYRNNLYNVTTGHQHRNFQVNTYEHCTMYGFSNIGFYLNYYSYVNEGFTCWRACGYLPKGSY